MVDPGHGGAAEAGAGRLLRALLELAFPSRCPGCGLRGTAICPPCWQAMPRLGAEVCPRCASPSRLGRRCGRCRDASGPLDGVRAACRFEGSVRAAIHDLKYRGVRGRVPLLGDLVVEAVERLPLAIDALVPVPLAAGRRRRRGFNQAELIARHVGERIGVLVLADSIQRGRETPPQVGLTAPERQRNLVGAFACPDASRVTGRRLALVDDVMTTGATLTACAEALKAHGAGRVYGLVVAREG